MLNPNKPMLNPDKPMLNPDKPLIKPTNTSLIKTKPCLSSQNHVNLYVAKKIIKWLLLASEENMLV